MKRAPYLLLLLTILVFTISCTNSIAEDISNNESIVIGGMDLNGARKAQKIFSINDFKVFSFEKTSVVNKLSEEVKEDFINNLMFGDGGMLATAKYVGIEKELSKEDQEIFWAVLGVEYLLLPDHKGYRCESPNNCKISSEYICMSGC